jgi:hypothetical protein
MSLGMAGAVLGGTTKLVGGEVGGDESVVSTVGVVDEDSEAVELLVIVKGTWVVTMINSDADVVDEPSGGDVVHVITSSREKNVRFTMRRLI